MKRYCEMCDEMVSGLDCPLCGAGTVKPEPYQACNCPSQDRLCQVHTPNTFNLHVTLVVLPSGQIQLYCTGEKSTLYQSWAHWFANGISSFVPGEVVKVRLA